jgi:hypothetical protein
LRQWQHQLQRSTDQIREATLGEPPEALSSTSRAELERLARRQTELAGRADDLASTMQTARDQTGPAQPRTAAAVSAGLELMDRTNLADQMRQSSHSIQHNQLGAATRQQTEVEQALGELAARIAPADLEAARRQLAQLGQRLQALADRQQAVIDETSRLDALRGEQGDWPPAAASAVRQLAAEQHVLSAEAERLLPSFEPSGVFRLALAGTRQRMVPAADRLEQGDTGEGTRQLQQQARRQLEQMVTALRSVPPPDALDSPPAGDRAGQGGPDGQRPPPTPRDLRMLVQLKLLREMQTEVQRRTEALDQLRQTSGGLTSSQQRQLAAVAREQGRLAELVLHMAGGDDSAMPDTAPTQADQQATGLDALERLPDQSSTEAPFSELEEKQP